MDLSFHAILAETYKSPSQRIRILSEHWIGSQAFCVNCGHRPILSHPNNSKIADFFCANCGENYELKSQKKEFGAKIVDGGHSAMMERLAGSDNPNFLLLSYDPMLLAVTNLLVIPRYFFTPEIIEKRRALPITARRAGWIGCNILLRSIPFAGRISLVRSGLVVPRADVLAAWRKTLFLQEQKDTSARGWLLNVMMCIEQLNQRTFSIDQMYRFEDHLKRLYPANRHIRPKIRQKLQVLRDTGYLRFSGSGTYQLVEPFH